MTAVLDFLRTSPVFWIFVTVLGYRVGLALRDRTGGHPLAQPVIVAVAIVIGMLSLLDVDYEGYMAGGSMIHLLLGPATVALAVPLYRQVHHLRAMLVPTLVAIPVGAAVSITSALLTVRLLGGGQQLERTLAAKSTTTPVAIAITEQVGGIPSLVAVLTIIVGMLGAVLGPAVLDRLHIRDPRARGLAVGAVSHGIGTSRCLHDDPAEGAFSGLSMGLTALATSLLVPLVIALL